MAGIFRAFLLRVPSRAGAGERELAAGAWLRPAAARRSGMEWLAIRRFSFAGATNGSDERAAEQAAMALDSLYIAYSRDAKPANAAEVRAAINGLFQQLENPSALNADQFASALRRIRAMLR